MQLKHEHFQFMFHSDCIYVSQQCPLHLFEERLQPLSELCGSLQLLLFRITVSCVLCSFGGWWSFSREPTSIFQVEHILPKVTLALKILQWNFWLIIIVFVIRSLIGFLLIPPSSWIIFLLCQFFLASVSIESRKNPKTKDGIRTREPNIFNRKLKNAFLCFVASFKVQAGPKIGGERMEYQNKILSETP